MYEARQRYQNVEYAETYDEKRFSSWLGRRINALDMRALDKATVDCEKGAYILDVPCGTGRLTTHLAEVGFRVTGADISKEMIEVAKRKSYSGNLVDLIVSPAESLPFPDDHFDHVTCGRFLAHLPSEERVLVLRELARVSRGTVIVGYHIRNRFADISRFIRTRGGIKNFNLSRVHMTEALNEIDRAGLTLLNSVQLVPIIHDYRYLILSHR